MQQGSTQTRTAGRRGHQACHLVLAVTLMLPAACRTSEPNAPVLVTDRAITAEAGAEVTLAPGETAELPGINLRIRVNRVVGDSRCPMNTNIMCVWAGSVVVELQGGPITGRQFIETRRLETAPGRDTTTIAGQPVRILRVMPAREGTAEIPPASYRIVLQAGTPK